MCLIPHWVRGAWDSGRCTGGAPQIYNEQMKRALQGLTDRKGTAQMAKWTSQFLSYSSPLPLAVGADFCFWPPRAPPVSV